MEIIQSLTTFMNDGGIFMWVILLCWIFGLSISFERSASLFLYDTRSKGLMAQIKKFLIENKLQDAIALCSNKKSLLPQILKSALQRANYPKESIQDAVEASYLELAPKVNKRLSYLELVANISTLIGLLGTIFGLIESFSAVSSASAAEKSKLLAMGISKAMNTTALGLISAISIMVVYTILSNKSEKILGEIEEHSAKLVDMLGARSSKKSSTTQRESA